MSIIKIVCKFLHFGSVTEKYASSRILSSQGNHGHKKGGFCMPEGGDDAPCLTKFLKKTFSPFRRRTDDERGKLCVVYL
ncbi:MAG: hypothetical protein DRP81_06025 [Candidatus Omnitrophota bacterium]|nr:MAG: hypothetical protein DRP81_06025 [Candidatus Omnitrophota bacterium]